MFPEKAEEEETIEHSMAWRFSSMQQAVFLPRKVKVFGARHEAIYPIRGNWGMKTVSISFMERMGQWEGSGQIKKSRSKSVSGSIAVEAEMNPGNSLGKCPLGAARML